MRRYREQHPPWLFLRFLAFTIDLKLGSGPNALWAQLLGSSSTAHDGPLLGALWGGGGGVGVMSLKHEPLKIKGFPTYDRFIFI